MIRLLDVQNKFKMARSTLLKLEKEGIITCVRNNRGVVFIEKDQIENIIEFKKRSKFAKNDIGEAYCSECGKLKLKESFYKRRMVCWDCMPKVRNREYKNYLTEEKKKLRQEYKKIWYKEKGKEYSKEYKKKNRKRINFINQLWNRGISEKEYNLLIEKCDNKCSICKNYVQIFNIDHDHNSGIVRGLLCHQCNLGLGNLLDDKTVLQSAIDYLEFCNLKEYHQIDYNSKQIKEYRKFFHELQECEICLFSHEKLCIDHDHKTNRVRGLLCAHCNQGIGHFRDNIKTLESAIAYLERTNG